MANQPDPEKVKVLSAEADKLDDQSQHKKLRAIRRRLNRARGRVAKLEGAEEKEVKEKNAPIVEEVKKRVTELTDTARKTLAAAGKAGRKKLKRLQRRLRKMQVLPMEERQKRTQKQSDYINKHFSDMTKGMKKVQGNAFVHSMRKKIKSLNKKLKKFARIAKKAEAAAPPAVAEKKA